MRDFSWRFYRERWLRLVTICLLLVYATAVSLVFLSCGGCVAAQSLRAPAGPLQGLRLGIQDVLALTAVVESN